MSNNCRFFKSIKSRLKVS